MTIVIPEGYAYHVLRFTQSGATDPQTVTLGTTWDPTGLLQDQIAAVSADLATAWVDNILPIQQDSYIFLEVVSKGASAVGDFEAVTPVGNPGGDPSVNPLPNNTCVLTRKVTGRAGRQERGRMFTPGILEDTDVDGVGTILPATVVTIQAAFDGFLTDFLAADPSYAMVILHNDAPLPVPDPSFILSFNVQSLAATQRRRMR